MGCLVYVLDEYGGGVLGSVPGEFSGEVVIVIRRPLVVAVFQFFIVGRLIDPLDPYVLSCMRWRSYGVFEKRGRKPNGPTG